MGTTELPYDATASACTLSHHHFSILLYTSHLLLVTKRGSYELFNDAQITCLGKRGSCKQALHSFVFQANAIDFNVPRHYRLNIAILKNRNGSERITMGEQGIGAFR
jgi:hypothetical protein